MKRLLIMSVGLFAAITLNAQVLSPEVVATSGKSLWSSTAQIDFTVGEVVTASLSDGTNLLTQGFHQPLIIIESLADNIDHKFIFNIYPNPAAQFVTVESPETSEKQIRIYDAFGRAVEVSGIFTDQITIDLQAITTGHYLMVITNPSGALLSTYNLIKQ